MDDLISRKRLLEHISAWQQANAGAETQTEYAVIESCYRMAQNFPTAYDVEAVVRELEKLRYYDDEYSNKCESTYNEALNDCIEIVKRGGRNEDRPDRC